MTTSSRTRLLIVALAGLLVVVPAAAKKRSVAAKKKIALTDFAKAERLHAALRARPQAERTKQEYKRVIDAYRRVYFLAPTSSRADASIFTVAQLYSAMGSRFEDAEASKEAIRVYSFLRDQYPGSKYRVDALFSTALIYRDDLDDPANARSAFEDFVKKYPRSERAKEARAAIRDIAEEAHAGKAAKRSPSTKEAKSSRRTDESKEKAEVTTAQTTQGDEPKPAAVRDDDPADDDIVAKPAPAPHGPPVRVTGIRHWSTPDYTRVAVDLGGETTYDSDRIDHPERIYFDLHNSHLAAALRRGTDISVDDGFVHKIRVAQFQPGETRVVLEVDHACDYSAFLLPNPARLIIDIHSKHPAQVQAKADTPKGSPPDKKVTETPKTEAVAKLEPVADTPSPKAEAESATADTAGSEPAKPASSAKNVRTASRKEKTRRARKSNAEIADVHEAKPTATGDRSLIRALGLKIGRIVVDAGHGGHDTGTIGPNGLYEKDLVLDVALRLGKLLQDRLGAEVIYTRHDDTFIPLEERTAIANQAKADLFISIHANSSRDPDARGVETYYLNFTTSPDALEVAARENAVSDQSIHQLQDLVKKIALKEKIEESREFAADVQHSMAASLHEKNRGVKQAPFIVLIGANMPSILAEISFVSNPTDARKLKSEAYRQKIAEALYRGVTKYASGLSGIKVAAKATPVADNTDNK